MGDTGNGDASVVGKPGGGIGPPVSGTEPLDKYKWWILGALALLLAAAAAFLLRKPAAGAAVAPGVAAPAAFGAVPANHNAALLLVLKEELFSLESEKISGTLSEGEYSEVKAALEIVLKRALKKN